MLHEIQIKIKHIYIRKIVFQRKSMIKNNNELNFNNKKNNEKEKITEMKIKKCRKNCELFLTQIEE